MTSTCSEAVRKQGLMSTGKLNGFREWTTTSCAPSRIQRRRRNPWLFSMRRCVPRRSMYCSLTRRAKSSLADALAASTLGAQPRSCSATRCSSPQGCKPSIPAGGRSVLEHVLGGDATYPARHAECSYRNLAHASGRVRFISEEIYEGRLQVSHKNCDRQTTVAGTGLRWLRAAHQAMSTSSTEEAEMVAAEIARLMGTAWTDYKGDERPLTVNDFMVVAPYNDQVRTIRDRLDDDPDCRCEGWNGRQVPRRRGRGGVLQHGDVVAVPT